MFFFLKFCIITQMDSNWYLSFHTAHPQICVAMGSAYENISKSKKKKKKIACLLVFLKTNFTYLRNTENTQSNQKRKWREKKERERSAIKTKAHRDFPGGPVVKTLPSSTGVVGLIPGQGAKMPHASWPKRPKHKTEAIL